MTQPLHFNPRTLTDWEAYVDNTTDLSDAEKRDLRDKISRKRAEVEADYHQTFAEESWRNHDQGEAMWQESQDLHGDFLDLHKRGREGRISAVEYAKEHDQLVRAQANLERRIEELERAAQRTDDKLADPVGYQTMLLRKYPSLPGVRLGY